MCCEVPSNRKIPRQPILERISETITGSLEKFFYRWGFAVATHPYKFILGSFLFTAICGLGFINFTQENRPDKLWIPRDSKFASDTDWLRRNFPTPLRESFAIFTADNVLVPEVMRAIIDIHERVEKISVKDGKKWKDICFKLPITKFGYEAKKRRRRSISTSSSINLSPDQDQAQLSLSSVSPKNVPKLSTSSSVSIPQSVETMDEDSFTKRTIPDSDSVELPSLSILVPASTPVPKTISESSFFGNALVNFDDAFKDDFFQENSVVGPTDLEFDPSLHIPEELYCSMINNLEEACWEVNPAELWSFNRSLIYNLTQEDIIRVINHQLISPVFGRSINYTAELGGHIILNDKGEVISAEAIRLKWVVAINQTAVDEGKAISDFSTGETADEVTWLWEKAWTELMQNISRSLPQGVQVFYSNGRSWGDITESLILDDGLMLVVGFFVMFAYISIMIGRFNMVEQRPLLSVAGITCVGFAVIVAYGIGAICFLMYGPVNKILPFMLLGIGIDDMFVIIQCWNNLFPSCLTKQSKLSIPERMGMALRHAGVSITITSLTDIAAFGVGASTIMPGLQSFCIYAAIGIIAVFILQATFFVAWFAVDQKRLEERRNGFFFWIKYSESEFTPSAWSQKSYFQYFFDTFFLKIVFTPVGKALVLLITAGFLGVNIYGNTLLRQEFDPIWFLPDESHLALFIHKRESCYPGTGNPAFIVADNVNWTDSFDAYEAFSEEFKNTEEIFSFDNWYDDFKLYANKNFGTNIPYSPLSPAKFKKFMGRFLYSPLGSKHRGFFKLAGNFSCGDEMPPIKMVMSPFRFKKFAGAHEHIPGMHHVKSIVANANLTYNSGTVGRMIPWSPTMITWETDELITAELYKNVVFSFACVLGTTFLLLANIRVCLFCGLCVIFTLVNVGGMMYFWGLTIDMISFIDIVLAVGLCVDYAAHIALAFMQCSGSRASRAEQAVRSIGPAVLNGGFSTFLAILLLANSQSHAFKSFFKIFTVVICFGLFHGLVFLPVLLSLLGPQPYSSSQDIKEELANRRKASVELRSLTANGHTNGNGPTSPILIPNGHSSSPLRALSPPEFLAIKNGTIGYGTADPPPLGTPAEGEEADPTEVSLTLDTSS